MATSTSVQPVPEAAAGNSFDQFVTRRLERAGVQVKMVDLATSVLLIVTVVLGVLLTVCVIDGWIMALGPWLRMTVLISLSAFALLVLARSIAPLLLRRINPAYSARMIEQGEPKFKNSLLNYVFLKSLPSANSKRVFEAVQAKAAHDLSAISIESAVDRSRLIQVGFALVGIALASGFYKLVSPKDPFDTVARVVAPLADIPSPSRVRIQNVEPGSVDVYFGETVDITANIRGANDTPVVLIYSTDDGQRVNTIIPLTRGDTTSEFIGQLTTSDAGIQQSLSYWVVAGDGRSPTYHVKVRPSPTIAVSKVELTPPHYTELPVVQQAGQADIEAIEGTNVHLEAIANQPIASASLELLKAPTGKNSQIAKAPSSLSTRDEAQSDKKLDFETVDRIPMAAIDRIATVDFQLLRSGDEQKFTHYRLKFSSRDGQRNRVEPVYAVRIKPDLAPEVEVLEPSQSKLQIPVNGKLTIKARALDPDFRVNAIRMVGLHKGKTIVEQNLVLDQPSGVGNVHGRFDFRPESVNLQPGDEIIFHVAAVDNRRSPLSDQPDPNITRSANYELTITPSIDSGNPPGQRGSDAPNEDQNSQANPDDSDPSESDEQKTRSQKPSDKSEAAGDGDSKQDGGQAGGSQSENQSSEDDAKPSEGSSGGGNSRSSDKNKSNPREDSGKSDEPNDSQPDDSQTAADPSADGRATQPPKTSRSKPGESNAGKGGDPAESTEPTPGNEPEQTDDSSGEGGKPDSKSNEESSAQPSSSQSREGSGGEGQKSSPDQASGDRTESSNDPANRNPSDSQQRESGEPGNPRPDPNEQSRAGTPNESSRPLDEASHDGERFEKLLERLDREKDKSGKQSSQNQSNQQSPARDRTGDQKSSASQENGTEDSQAAAKNEFGQDSESSEKSADNDKPAEAASPENRNASDMGETTGDSPNQKPGDAGSPAAESPSNDGTDDRQSAGDESPKSSGQDSSGESTEKGSADSNQDPTQSSESPGESESGADSAPSNADNGKGETSNDASATDPKAVGRPRPTFNTSQFPDSSADSASGLDAKFDTPQERELLERSRRVTDLVVEYLKDHQHKPDADLLDDMNWTEQELRDFVARWEHLKQAASQGEKTAELRYSEALRSLGLQNQTEQARQAKMQRDEIRDLNEDGSRSRPPEKFAEAFRDFSKGRAKRAGDQ